AKKFQNLRWLIANESVARRGTHRARILIAQACAAARTLILNLRVQRKHHKIVVGRELARCLGWCPHRHRCYGLHRLLLLAPSQECCECTQTNDPGRGLQPRIEVPRVGDRLCTIPPKQHSHADAEPSRSTGEVALE